MDNEQIRQVEQTVRFQHPEKLLTTVAPLDEPVIATILSLEVATYRETKHQLEEQVREAAGPYPRAECSRCSPNDLHGTDAV